MKENISNNRDFGLDLVRCIAILSVVILHFGTNYSLVFKKNIFLPIPDGVSIFFVLSGYLIGSIIIKSFEKEGIQKKTILKFWIMRWFRTLPNYYFLSMVVFVLSGFHLGWRNLFFLQNFYKHSYNAFVETWSLSVEEWFYLLTPILIFIIANSITKKMVKILLITAMSMAVFSLSMRLFYYFYVMPTHTSIDFFAIHRLVITRLDGIAYGIFGAIIKHYYPFLWNRNKKKLFFIGLLIFITYTVFTTYQLRGVIPNILII